MKSVVFIGIIIATIALLLGLGSWQLQRLTWKENLIEAQQQALEAAPQVLEKVLEYPQQQQQFRPVTLQGYFLENTLVPVGLRFYEGRGHGYHLVVPFKITEGLYAGNHILVTIGWVALEEWQNLSLQQQATSSNFFAKEKIQEIVGILRLPDTRTWFAPQNAPLENVWHTLYIEEIASFYHLKPFLPLTVQATTMVEGHALPVVVLPAVINLPNNHLQYAVTWFALAAILSVMTLVFVKSKRKKSS